MFVLYIAEVLLISQYWSPGKETAVTDSCFEESSILNSEKSVLLARTKGMKKVPGYKHKKLDFFRTSN